jgi:hypothetical protein
MVPWRTSAPCEKCGKGTMEYAFVSRTSEKGEKMHAHKCTYCTNEEWYQERYPRMEYRARVTK